MGSSKQLVGKSVAKAKRCFQDHCHSMSRSFLFLLGICHHVAKTHFFILQEGGLDVERPGSSAKIKTNWKSIVSFFYYPDIRYCAPGLMDTDK